LSNAGPTKSLTLNYHSNVFVIPAAAAASYTADGSVRAYAPWPNAATRTGTAVSSDRQLNGGTAVVGVGTQGAGTSGTLTLSAGGGYNVVPGDLVCSYLTVDKWSVVNDAVTGTVAASNVKCIQVVKTPQLSLLGADSVSGAEYWGSTAINKAGGFIGSQYANNNPQSTDQGSFSQYGLLANQKSGNSGADITNFGSGGWTAGGVFANNNNTKTCQLWFANTTGNGQSSNCSASGAWQGGNLGNVSRTISLPNNGSTANIPQGDLGRGYGYSASAINLWNLDVPSNNVSYAFAPAGGTMTMSSAVPNGGVWTGIHMTLYIQGNVNITSNISILGSDAAGKSAHVFANLQQLPLLTIFATGNITVDQSVTNVDATLVAGGHFQSCSQGANASATLSETGGCSKQLNINGAIATSDSPVWYRTFGADSSNLTTPSEIVNYTPNLFLAANSVGQTSNTGGYNWNLINAVSLPARY
jgi:hypothetical protein